MKENPWVFSQSSDADFSSRLASAWTQTLVPSPSPGEKFVSFLSLIDLMLVLAGLVLGGSAAFMLLHYDGTSPINVLQYLGVFVLLQLVLLLLLGLHLGFGFRLGVFQEALRNFAYVRTTYVEKIGKITGGFEFFRKVRNLYSAPESWFILKITQHFAIFFQISALIVTMSLIGFTDLAFGWSSTLNISAETFHRMLSAVSLPWTWLGSEWLPSMEQVRGTQFFRLENRYVSGVGSERIGDVSAATSWWRFLIAAHVTYGLLPRLVVWGLSNVMFRRSLKQSSEESLAFSAVKRRLLAANPALAAASYNRPTANGDKTTDQAKIGPAHVIVWRDLPADDSDIQFFLSQRGIELSCIHKVGGKAADVDGAVALSNAQGSNPWVVLVEDWESPGKGFKNLIDRLRRADTNRAVHILVVKVDGSKLTMADDKRSDLWRRHIYSLADRSVWLHQ